MIWIFEIRTWDLCQEPKCDFKKVLLQLKKIKATFLCAICDIFSSLAANGLWLNWLGNKKRWKLKRIWSHKNSYKIPTRPSHIYLFVKGWLNISSEKIHDPWQHSNYTLSLCPHALNFNTYEEVFPWSNAYLPFLSKIMQQVFCWQKSHNFVWPPCTQIENVQAIKIEEKRQQNKKIFPIIVFLHLYMAAIMWKNLIRIFLCESKDV